MKKKYILPICLISLDLEAGVMCAIGGDYKKLIYWIAAAVLTAAVTF